MRIYIKHVNTVQLYTVVKLPTANYSGLCHRSLKT
jgi:hypothetical protein